MRSLAIVLGSSALLLASQGPVAPSALDVERMVTGFFSAADQYQKTFRNLTAEETRVNEEFDQTGRVRKRREIVADLLVYRSPRGGDAAVEYRDVRSVDGKAIGNRGKRTLDLIGRATRESSIEQELRRVDKESQRYDFSRHIFGFTINLATSRTMRDDFRFEWAGREQLNGHSVVMLDYRSIAPAATDNRSASYYRDMGVTSFFTRGRLWLDAATFQVRRRRWEFAGVHPASQDLIPLVVADSTYVESRFDILVPERILVEFYDNQASKAKPAFGLAARTAFTYGAFRRFDVDTKEELVIPPVQSGASPR